MFTVRRREAGTGQTGCWVLDDCREPETATGESLSPRACSHPLAGDGRQGNDRSATVLNVKPRWM